MRPIDQFLVLAGAEVAAATGAVRPAGVRVRRCCRDQGLVVRVRLG
jgi:hypothetical protein